MSNEAAAWQDHLLECFACRAYAVGERDARCEPGEAIYRAFRGVAEASRPRALDPVEAKLDTIDARLETVQAGVEQLDVRLRQLEAVVSIVLQQPLVRRWLGADRINDALGVAEENDHDRPL